MTLPRWATTEQVREYLHVDHRTLQALMADTAAAGVAPVWLDYAQGAG